MCLAPCRALPPACVGVMVVSPTSGRSTRWSPGGWRRGIDDALIQPYSGHATRQSLEIYSRLALADAQQRYDDVIGDFPV
jgi:hypothetical protein